MTPTRGGFRSKNIGRGSRRDSRSGFGDADEEQEERKISEDRGGRDDLEAFVCKVDERNNVKFLVPGE